VPKKVIKPEEFIKEKIEKEKVLANEEIFEANFVFRIALKNKTGNNFFVELRVEGNEKNHFTGKFETVLKNQKEEVVVCNLHSRNVEAQFEGLSIKMALHQYPNGLDKNYHEF
jgi:hypothetical protein